MNRVGILANYAGKGMGDMAADDHWRFKTRMLSIALWYRWTQFWKIFDEKVFGKTDTKGFEDQIEAQMQEFAKDLGLYIDEEMFDAYCL